MTELVTRMTMGQDVPEWLLIAEPEESGAPRGHFRFCVDVDVIDTPNYYVVMPHLAEHPAGAPVIDNVGMIGHRVMAASKPVSLALAGAVFYGAEATPAFRELERQRREALLRGAAVVAIPDPHPTFWSRLLYALRGR